MSETKTGAIITTSRKKERGERKMITVPVKNGNVDAALKRFKQKVAKSGLPSEVKKKQAFDKPGVERRNAKKEAIKNSRKAARRERNAA